MNMVEGMTGAADEQDEVVETPYEKSGAFIGVLSGVALGGISGALIERKPRMELSFEDDDEIVFDEKLSGEGVAK